MQVALIGTGNIAWHLAQACTAAGHQLVAVASRTISSGEEFTHTFPHALPTSVPGLKNIPVDVIIIAVPDDTLRDVASKLEVQPGTVVVHTSGSQPASLLEGIAGAKTGVFYPVQTFTKYKPLDFSKVPVLIEGQDGATVSVLRELGNSLSGDVQVKDSTARKQLHLAAVFACNFTNHLLCISKELLNQANLPSDLLQPLILETINKALAAQNPFEVQTGPAIRKDQNVIAEHLNMLQKHPVYRELYQVLTSSIQNQPADKIKSKS